MRLARLLLLILPLLASEGRAQAVPAKGFGLMSRAAYALGTKANRVNCGIGTVAFGSVGNDAFNGCFWPSTSPNNYVAAGGLQFAGVIGPDGGPWAGDTSGAFWYSPTGTTEHGEVIIGIYSSASKDSLRWPDVARISTGADGGIYRPEVRGQVGASQEDFWSLAWDGNVNLRAGRTHPMGVVVETRVLAWDHPRGNEDILYFVYTLYNVTSTEPSAYAAIRPGLRDTLLSRARALHAQVQETLGLQLPAGGYTINSLHASLSEDGDVGNAASNLASVNLPLSTSFVWEPAFDSPVWWTFDPADHSRPFFRAPGFAGVKLLASPGGGNATRLFTVTSSGATGGVADPLDVSQLYRYLSGNFSPSGDAPCNTGNPLETRICYVGNVPRDVRSVISAGPTSLAPGQFTQFVVAQLLAAPVGSCLAPCNVLPGDPLRIGDPLALATGANPIDSVTGYTGFVDLNGDGAVQGGELRAAPRSLLAKAQLAQAFFDSKFIVPEAPDAPDFFLIPGDGQVTVLWKPSTTETTGDPFFASAASATTVASDGSPVINGLYDPNYRQFDVEGYRIYRGRTSNPAEMTLLQQYDYQGTVVRDYAGRVNPSDLCAPGLGIRGSCPVAFDSLVPGQAATVGIDQPITYQLVQEREGDRIPLPDGSTVSLKADTIGGENLRCVCDTGVPFMFVDRTVRNSFQYFYTVTAFDVNSLQSGPSSFESPRRLKGVRPVRPASNSSSGAHVAVVMEGRGVVLTDTVGARVDGSGRFDKAAAPANGWSVELLNLAADLVSEDQEARIRLDSLQLGQVELIGCCTNGREGIPVMLYYTVTAPQGETHLVVPVQQVNSNFLSVNGVARTAPLFIMNPDLAARYNGTATPIQAAIRFSFPSTLIAGDWGISGLNASQTGLTNGARWFDGPSPRHNEVAANPMEGNCNSPSGCLGGTTFNNAGTLTGVTTVYQPISYFMFNREWRNMSQSQAGARRAADYNLFWGTNGAIDSVIDVTHNVPVPFSAEAGGTWGVLNTSAQGDGGHDGRPMVLTPTDWTCVEPFRSRLTQPTNGWFPCTSPSPFLLSRQAQLGSIAFGAGDNQSLNNPQSVRNPGNLSFEPGFALYLSGTISQFGLIALPARGTVWSLRDYVGTIGGGPDHYNFYGDFSRPFTAVGAEIVVRLNSSTTLVQARDADLRRIHTVPDPFYVRTNYEESRSVRFVNLPDRATIRIYSAGGVLVQLLNHASATLSGEQVWDLKSRSGQRVASGVYFYHVEAGDARRVGRMTVVNEIH